VAETLAFGINKMKVYLDFKGVFQLITDNRTKDFKKAQAMEIYQVIYLYF